MADPRLQDDAFTVNERLIDETIRRAVYLGRYTNNEVAQLLISLDERGGPFELVIDRIASALTRLSARGPDRALQNTERGQLLIESILQILNGGMNEARKKIVASLADFAVVESQWQVNSIKTSLPTDLAVRVFSPPTTVLRTILTQRAIEGQTLRKWFKQIGETASSSIVKSINVGMAQGDTTEQILERVKGVGGVIPSVRNGIDSLVRTTIAHVSNQTKDEVFQANSDIIKAIRIVAVLDGRTTPICQAQDGKVYELGKGPRPPFHFRCRTTVVPVLKSMAELGFDVQDFPVGTRASMNGQVPADMTYEQWLRRQSRSFQDDVLGKARADLFRRKKLSLDRFVDYSGRRLTLEELARLN